METIPITRETLTETLRAAVAERGEDYEYDPSDWGYIGRCVYQDGDGNPSCLFGLALSKMGQPLPASDQFIGIDSWLRRLGVYDEPLLKAAQVAQDAQDDRAPWGEALEEFSHVLDSFREDARDWEASA